MRDEIKRVHVKSETNLDQVLYLNFLKGFLGRDFLFYSYFIFFDRADDEMKNEVIFCLKEDWRKSR